MTTEDYQMHMLAATRSIDATLKELLALSKSKRAGTAKPADDTAAAAELDAPYGDEILKAKMPRDWSGVDFKGARMSEAPPELLDLIASRADYFAQQNDERGEKDDKGRPKSYYDRQTARRARGWAARKRSGWTAPAAETSEMPAAGDISW